MSEKDLMVGFCVYDKIMNRYVVVHGISETHNFIWVNYANGSGIYTRGFDEVEAISLSLAVLTKNCGAKLSNNEICISNGDTTLVFQKHWKGGIYYTGGEGVQLSEPIEYLHELQILFKALTKQELEIKPIKID